MEGVFQRRLCCFAVLIWGKKIIKVIILLLCLPVCPSSCCPPRTPDGGSLL